MAVKVIFTIWDVGVGTPPPTSNFELGITDGTPGGTTTLKEINTTAAGVGSYPWGFTQLGKEVVFFADDGIHGMEPWVTDGTSVGTILIKDVFFGISPSTNGTATAPDASRFHAFNGFAYFGVNDNVHGQELWRTDGTPGGTTLFKDINTNGAVNAGASNPFGYTVAGNFLYFDANDGTHGAELWKTDGTTTTLVVDTASGGTSTSSFATPKAALNGKLIFTADPSGFLAANTFVYITDGSTTTQLTFDPTIYPSSFATQPLNGFIYFAATDASHGTELWRTDGATGGTGFAGFDIAAGNGNSQPQSLTVSGTHLFFQADDNTHGVQLWATDGVSAPVTMTSLPLSVGSGSRPMIDVNGTLYFGVSNSGGIQLWKSNGTQGGTVPVAANVFQSLGNLQNINGTLFFDAQVTNAQQLWQTTGNGTGISFVTNRSAWFSGAPDAPYTFIRRTTPLDFDANSKSDILFQNDNGQAVNWLINGISVLSQNFVGPNPGTTWKAKGGGDFDNDRHADILWQRNDGAAAVWLMNGTSVISQNFVGPNPGTAWTVEGTGDFDNDSHADILWQRNDSAVVVWLMNGTNVTTQAFVGPIPGAPWHVKTAADFDGDGRSDILFQNDNGQAAIWLLNGTSLVTQAFVGPNPGTAWSIKGAGDFDGDGHADILWQRNDGAAAVWFMNGTNLLSQAFVGPNPTWTIKGAEDFDGDGHSDIVWQRNDSAVVVCG